MMNVFKKGLIFLGGILLFLLFLEGTIRLTALIYNICFHVTNPVNKEKDNQIVILCLGESTTAFGLNDSYPSQLARILNGGKPTGKFNVINAGMPATNSQLILGELDETLAKYHPNIVVTMIGINDNWEIFGVAKKSVLEETIFRYSKAARLLKMLYGETFTKRSPSLKPEEKIVSKPDVYVLTADEEEMARQFLAKGDVSGAHKYFDNLIEKSKEPADLAASVAKLFLNYSETGGFHDISSVVKYCGKALEKNPRHLTALKWLGHSYYLFYRMTSKDRILLQKAQENMRKFLDLGGRSKMIHFNLGDIAEINGDWQTAEKEYLAAISQDADDTTFEPHIYLSLIALYKNTGRSEQAAQYLEKAQSIFPNNPMWKSDSNGNCKEKGGIHYSSSEPLFSDATPVNYGKISAKIRESGARHVAMQYPRRKLESLREMLNTSEGVYFLGNEENFNLALKNHSFNELFVDNFACDFGHATPLGNSLIAKNLGDFILKIIPQDLFKGTSDR